MFSTNLQQFIKQQRDQQHQVSSSSSQQSQYFMAHQHINPKYPLHPPPSSINISSTRPLPTHHPLHLLQWDRQEPQPNTWCLEKYNRLPDQSITVNRGPTDRLVIQFKDEPNKLLCVYHNFHELESLCIHPLLFMHDFVHKDDKLLICVKNQSGVTSICIGPHATYHELIEHEYANEKLRNSININVLGHCDVSPSTCGIDGEIRHKFRVKFESAEQAMSFCSAVTGYVSIKTYNEWGRRNCTSENVMTRQKQQKLQQLAAAVAAANLSWGSAAAAKLTTEPAAKRQKQQMGVEQNSKSGIRGKKTKENSKSNTATADRNVPKNSSQKQQQHGAQLPSKRPNIPPMPSTSSALVETCEICDTPLADLDKYRLHLQKAHEHLLGKTASDMVQGASVECCRCREHFWTYEGLDRHEVMSHGLVTLNLLAKAHRQVDGSCKLCGKSYGFDIVHHLITEHQGQLCCAEIMYSCDMCASRFASYQKLGSHSAKKHHSKNMVN